MSLEEFKFIYWMEYAHRMWGRALGFVFAVPAVYFGMRGYINLALSKNLGLFFLMGGTQGLVGWWMVKSGLQVPLPSLHTPYRSLFCVMPQKSLQALCWVQTAGVHVVADTCRVYRTWGKAPEHACSHSSNAMSLHALVSASLAGARHCLL